MRKTIFVVMGLLLILCCFCLVEAQKIKTADGVKVILNGKKPTPAQGQPTKITLTEELTLGGGANPDESFSDVSTFVVDKDGHVLALDIKDRKIKIFDSTGKFLRAIGKPGQGPGELGMPSGIQITAANELLVEDVINRRLAYFKVSGEFIRNVSTADKFGLVSVFLDPQGNFMGREMGLAEGNAKMFFEIKKYDQNLKPLFTLDKIEFAVPIPGSGTKLNIMEMISVYQFDSQGNILYGRNANYEIKIYNQEGKHIRTIQKEYEPVKITPEDIKEMLERIPNTGAGVNTREMFTFPEYFPPFQNFILDDEGRLYVRTWEKGKARGEYVFDVFDPEGKFIAQFISKSDLRILERDRAYGIEENDDGFRVIKRYAVGRQ